MRVAVIRGGGKVFLHRSGGNPAQQVQGRTGLVVCSGRACSPKRLLTDDGAGGLVVDVEIARTVTQAFGDPVCCDAIAGEYRSGESGGAG